MTNFACNRSRARAVPERRRKHFVHFAKRNKQLRLMLSLMYKI